METSASFEARSAPSSYPTQPGSPFKLQQSSRTDPDCGWQLLSQDAKAIS